MDASDTCSAHSLAHGESPHGTGVSAIHWVGLEVPGAWRPKALKDNDLPEAVQAWLLELMARGDCRPVFVKRRGRREGLTVWYANLADGRVHHFTVASHGEVVELPWHALFAGTTEAGRSEVRPLFVCTHSTRDHCCGLYGAGVARALEKAAPGRVWQCSHLGGHRFAATLVALPEGVHYGRVRAEDAPRLIEALDAGGLHDLAQVRGECRYPMAVQAAVLQARAARGSLGLNEVTATEWSELDGTVHVRLDAEGQALSSSVHKATLEVSFPKSCRAEARPMSRWEIEAR